MYTSCYAMYATAFQTVMSSFTNIIDTCIYTCTKTVAGALYTLHIPGVYVLDKTAEHEVKFFPIEVFRIPYIENL